MKSLSMVRLAVMFSPFSAACAVAGESSQLGLNAWAGGGLAQMMIGLIVILVIIAGAVWLMRRYAPLRSGEGAIRVIGGIALGARERIVLVEVSGERVLVGIAPGRLQTLHVFKVSAPSGPAASGLGKRENDE